MNDRDAASNFTSDKTPNSETKIDASEKRVENGAAPLRVVAFSPFPDASAAENERQSATEQAPNDAAFDDPDDAFFSRGFSFDETQKKNESFDDAFAGGLKSLFDAEVESDVSSKNNGADDEKNVDAESDAERFQRDLESERRESLDGALLQNDADFLYEAGAKYENPRVSDADFEKKTDAAPRRVAIAPSSILEAMLFVGDRDNKPLTLRRATELMRNVSEQEALEALADLNERYFRDGAPYRIVRDGDGYRLALLAEFDGIAAQFAGKTKEFKLSQLAIDVLALVAYRQPIALAEILDARENAANVLTQLAKRDLVVQEKRVVDKKKTVYYKTTDRFLKLFNLASLDDLPLVGDVDYR